MLVAQYAQACTTARHRSRKRSGVLRAARRAPGVTNIRGRASRRCSPGCARWKGRFDEAASSTPTRVAVYEEFGCASGAPSARSSAPRSRVLAGDLARRSGSSGRIRHAGGDGRARRAVDARGVPRRRARRRRRTTRRSASPRSHAKPPRRRTTSCQVLGGARWRERLARRGRGTAEALARGRRAGGADRLPRSSSEHPYRSLATSSTRPAGRRMATRQPTRPGRCTALKAGKHAASRRSTRSLTALELPSGDRRRTIRSPEEVVGNGEAPQGEVRRSPRGGCPMTWTVDGALEEAIKDAYERAMASKSDERRRARRAAVTFRFTVVGDRASRGRIPIGDYIVTSRTTTSGSVRRSWSAAPTVERRTGHVRRQRDGPSARSCTSRPRTRCAAARLDDGVTVHAVHPERGPEAIVEKARKVCSVCQISEDDDPRHPGTPHATWRIAPAGGFTSRSSDAMTFVVRLGGQIRIPGAMTATAMRRRLLLDLPVRAA